MQESVDNIVTVVVDSCDNYEDTWIPCSKSLERNWPDCPYPAVLVTETKKNPDNTVFKGTINIDDRDWCLRLNKALLEIETPYVFMFLEDQWPIERVDQESLDELLNYMEENKDIGIIYIEPSGEGGVKECKKLNESFNEIPFGAPYRLSCAVGFFRRDYLIKITEKGGSAWDFERKRSFDSETGTKRVLETRKRLWKRLDAPGAITRGKWVRNMRGYADIIGVRIDYNRRPELSRREVLSGRIKAFVFNINPKLIVRIQNLFHS